MGTRAIYTFKDEHTTIHVYKHWDNYPDGAKEFILNAKGRAWELPRFEADEFAASFVAANKDGSGNIRLVGSRDGEKMMKPWEMAGDAEYRYEITCKHGKLNVVAFDVSYWGESPVEKKIYEGEPEGLGNAVLEDA